MRVLALDTATESCSTALLIDGAILERELECVRGHAEHILGMIDALLREAGIALGSLDAIAFGRGPGSFTGVRLAASVTQGLAFGAGTGIVAVSDLQALAARGFALAPQLERVLVCNDARMNEVYYAGYARRGEHPVALGPERVGTAAALAGIGPDAAGIGRGFAVYPGLAERLGVRVPSGWERLLPHARQIAQLAVAEVRAGRVLDAAEALPSYVRDTVAQPSSM
jgi:tRNA threonylcarbamoyladenosine biosynthesis protein TsaB